MKKTNILKKIENAGLKKTKYRVNIIDLLEKADGLLSASDIHQLLIDNDIQMDLSTVYRTLEKLTENNIINRIELEKEKQSLYEYNREKHHHFMICKSCNKIETIYDCPLTKYEEDIKAHSDFLITGHKIEFYGYCKNCRKRLKIN
ncbi:MAG: transcriptional repressor [Candidatus Izimaplasma sp.]|nr:transcriptional repressor [Candidatus Izimaplasma bacterium]